MRIPFVDLKSAIAATEPAWRANLAELHDRSSYILGAQLAAFEKEFAAAMNTKYAVGVASGSDAITVGLRAMDIRDGDVLTSALTAPFTAVAIRAAGPRPVFADIDPETLLIDSADAASRMTRRIRAVIPVHLYGQVCDMATLRRLVSIPILQDACQAHGAPLKGLRAYSFYPTKNLGALGDGGALVTDDKRQAKRMTEIRDGGRRGGQVSYIEGINSRLDEMQACYLRAFLPHLESWNARRRQIAALYDRLLAQTPGIRLVRRHETSVCHLYVVRAKRRTQLQAHLAKQGIATGIHYPVPLHLHPAFAAKNLKRGSLPNAEKACKEIISLPIGPFLNNLSVEKVAETVVKFYS